METQELFLCNAYAVITSAIFFSHEESRGARKSTYAFGGLNHRPRILVLSLYPVVERRFRDRDLRVLANPQHQQSASEILNRLERILARFEDCFGRYPFPTLTVVEAPQVLSRDYLMGSHVAGLGLKGVVLLARDEFEGDLSDKLLAHELAHQWWGALVGSSSEKKSGGLSLIEGLAEFSSLLFLEASLERDLRRQELAAWARMTRRVIEEHGERPLRDLKRDISTDPKTALVYCKGAYVFEMIRDQIGTDRFLEVIRELIKQWKGGRPTDLDFEVVLERVTGQEWTPFLDRWVREKGLPRLTVRYSAKQSASSWGILVKVSQASPYFDLEIPVRVHTESSWSDAVAILDGEETMVELMSTEEPTSITVNPDRGVLLGELEVVRVTPEEIE